MGDEINWGNRMPVPDIGKSDQEIYTHTPRTPAVPKFYLSGQT